MNRREQTHTDAIATLLHLEMDTFQCFVRCVIRIVTYLLMVIDSTCRRDPISMMYAIIGVILMMLSIDQIVHNGGLYRELVAVNTAWFMLYLLMLQSVDILIMSLHTLIWRGHIIVLGFYVGNVIWHVLGSICAVIMVSVDKLD